MANQETTTPESDKYKNQYYFHENGTNGGAGTDKDVLEVLMTKEEWQKQIDEAMSWIESLNTETTTSSGTSGSST